MAVHGKTGYVVVSGSSVSAGTWCATEWSISGSVEGIDVTTFCSDGARDVEAGFEEWEGSVTLLDTKGNLLGNYGVIVLGNDECSYSGSIMFNSHEATNNVNEIFDLTWGFQFKGAVSISA
jgi:hypothetical protein